MDGGSDMSVTAELEWVDEQIACIRDGGLNRRSAYYEECPNLRESLRRELQDLRTRRHELARKVNRMYREELGF